MSTTRLWAAALACVATFGVAHAQDRLPPRLTVTGEAHVSVAPDYAVIRLGVTAQAKTAKEAIESNARLASALVAALRGAGVDDKDIQTTRLSLQPTYESNPSGRTGRINGFSASNQ